MSVLRRGGVAAGCGALAVVLAACGGASTGTAAGGSPSPGGDASTAPAAGATPSATPTPPPRTLTLVATGDVLLHERLWNTARADAAASGQGPLDFRPLIAGVAPYTSAADLAVCHMEVPLAPAEGPYTGYPVFSGPPQMVDALAEAGYDACTTASNHTFDRGAAGVDRTLDHLDARGLAHAGSARTPEEAQATTMLDAAGVSVALLSYTYGFNGIPYPDGQTWRANLIDEARILADAATARQRGAEIVVVAMHWGTEYVHEPNDQQRELAPRLIASPDIDLLLGHHAHVVQPLQPVGGEWVAYGLGNMVAAHRTPLKANAEGLLVRFTFTEQPGGGFATTRAEYVPLLVTDAQPVRLVDVPSALATGGGPADRLQTALERTTGVVTSLGGAEAGLAPAG